MPDQGGGSYAGRVGGVWVHLMIFLSNAHLLIAFACTDTGELAEGNKSSIVCSKAQLCLPDLSFYRALASVRSLATDRVAA